MPRIQVSKLCLLLSSRKKYLKYNLAKVSISHSIEETRKRALHYFDLEVVCRKGQGLQIWNELLDRNV